MKGNLLQACVVSFLLTGVASAQVTASSPQSSNPYTHSQLKQMLREAHTPEQFRVLAGYYDQQQKSYLKEAVEEKREWDRRSENVMGVAAKYPRPVDSARNLYEYYIYKANESGVLSMKYGQLGAASAPAHLQ
jgi:hypothetical protein